MRYISLFSGIEAATVAWEQLGWEAVAFCEVDKFPSAVLAHRFPNVPNLGDITKVDWREVIENYGSVDLIVGGSPCQSFSIAGGRASLDGESNLMFEYIRAIRDVRPTWFLWENVPGVLNTRDDAFAQLLREVQDIGYGSLAWRVFDAQFFGVAQRRRRVFLVGCARGGGASAAVLFEPDSVCGNTQSSKQKRKELTGAVEKRAGIGGFKYHQGANAGSIGYQEEQSPTLSTDHNPVVMAFDTTQITNPDNNAHPDFGKPCHTLNAKAHTPTICLQTDHMGQNGTQASIEICKTLDVGSQTPVVCLQTGDDMAGSLTARYDSSPCADRGQNIVCVSDDQAKAAIDVDMAGSLKVGGGVP